MNRLRDALSAFPVVLGGYALAAVIIAAISLAGRW